MHSACTTRPQKLEDLMIELFFVGFSVTFQLSVMLLGNDVITRTSSPLFHVEQERQRDENRHCSMTSGAKPEVPASDFSRRLPILYSFVVSEEVSVALICKL